MREIKFRGQRIDNSEWVYGDLQQSPINTKIACNWQRFGPFDQFLFDAIEVDPDTVGQFTGLKDRNGKEIYEGDLIKHYSHSGPVRWNKENACFETEDDQEGPFYITSEDEVIGTTHDKGEAECT